MCYYIILYFIILYNIILHYLILYILYYYITIIMFIFQTKGVFTQKRTIIVCSIVPVICLCIYSAFFFFMGVYPINNYNQCGPKQHFKSDTTAADAFKALVQLWILLYFFIPAAVIVILNIVILSRLSRAKRIHQTVVQRSKHAANNNELSSSVSNKAVNGSAIESSYRESSVSSLSSTSTSSSGGDGVSGAGETGASQASRMSEVTRQHLSSIR